MSLALVENSPTTTPEWHELAEKYVNFVYYLAHRYPSIPLPFEDKVSFGFEGLCQAAQSFDPSKGFKFVTYASRVILNRWDHEVRFRMAKKRNYYAKEVLIGAPTNYQGTDTPMFDLQIEPADIEDIEARVSTKLDVIDYLKSVDSRERQVILARLQGHTQEEIGKKFGLSQPLVSRILAGIKVALRTERKN